MAGAGWDSRTMTFVSVTRQVLVTVPVNASVPPGGTGKGGQSIVTTRQLAVTTWLHIAELPHESVATQVRVITCGHVPLVAVPKTDTTGLAVHGFDAVGGSKLQAVPPCTVLLGAQTRLSTGMHELISELRSKRANSSNCS